MLVGLAICPARGGWDSQQGLQYLVVCQSVNKSVCLFPRFLSKDTTRSSTYKWLQDSSKNHTIPIYILLPGMPLVNSIWTLGHSISSMTFQATHCHGKGVGYSVARRFLFFQAVSPVFNV